MKKATRVFKVLGKNSLLENLRLLHIILLFVQAKLIVRFMPLKRYIGEFKEEKHASFVDLQPYHQEISLIRRLRVLVPWNATCLEEALVFKKYFRKYRIVIPIFVGLRKGMELKAHAWIMTDSYQGFSTIKV